MKKKNKVIIFILLSVAIVIFIVTLFVAIKDKSKKKVKYGNAISYITELYDADAESNNLKKDNTIDANIRYHGENPNNYVSFNNELWRIIGVFGNNIKLIRNESLGVLSWDSSDSSVNNGYGVNEWSQADLKEYLNTMYYGGTTVTCYNGANNKTTTCPSASLNENAKSMIDNHTWATGAVKRTGVAQDPYMEKLYTIPVYDEERGMYTGTCITKDIYCNDTVTRTTKWTGYVALPYLTDYVYSSSEDLCSNYMKGKYDVWTHNANDLICYKNNWMYANNQDEDGEWVLSAVGSTFQGGSKSSVWHIVVDGGMFHWGAANPLFARPSVYLKSDVKITSGTGTSSDPYILEI